MWGIYLNIAKSILWLIPFVLFLHWVFNSIYMTNKWVKRESVEFLSFLGFMVFKWKEEVMLIFILIIPALYLTLLSVLAFTWPICLIVGIWIAIAFKLRSMHDNKASLWTPKDHIWDEIASHMNPSSSPKAEEVINLLDKVDDIVDRRESHV